MGRIAEQLDDLAAIVQAYRDSERAGDKDLFASLARIQVALTHLSQDAEVLVAQLAGREGEREQSPLA